MIFRPALAPLLLILTPVNHVSSFTTYVMMPHLPPHYQPHLQSHYQAQLQPHLQPHLQSFYTTQLKPYLQPHLQPHLQPYFEVSKPLQHEDLEVVILEEASGQESLIPEEDVVIIEEGDEDSDISDDVDIIELTDDVSFECDQEGNFPNPLYCDKYYSCKVGVDGVMEVHKIHKMLKNLCFFFLVSAIR